MPDLDETNMETPENTVIGVMSDFVIEWKRCDKETRRELEDLLPVIDIWLEIRNNTIQKLEKLAGRTNLTQINAGRVVNTASTGDLFGRVTRFFSGASEFLASFFPGSNQTMSCLGEVGDAASSVKLTIVLSAIAAGAKAAEIIELKSVSSSAEIALKYDLKESQVFHRCINDRALLQKFKRISAIKIIAAGVQSGVFDSIGDTDNLNIIKSHENLLTKSAEIPESVVNACYSLLENLNIPRDFNVETQLSISQILADRIVLWDLSKLFLTEIAVVGFDFSFGTTTLPESITFRGFLSKAIESVIICYKYKELEEYNSRPMLSNGIKNAATQLNGVKILVENLRNYIESH